MRAMRAALVLSLLALAGCELIADFDRSKIPRMRADGGLDGSMPDGDASTDETGEPDADLPIDEDDAGGDGDENDAG